MSQPPAPYDRSWSFTNFSQSNPTTPHQGQKIDQELNNARTAINATISRLGEIQADDGKIRTTALNLPVIAEEVEPLLTDGPVQAVNAAGAQQIGLVNAAGVAGVASLNAVLTSQNAIDALAARDAAQSAAYNADISRIASANSAGLANTYANTALQAKNSAIVHAQVAVDAAASIPLIVGPVGPAGPQGQQGIQGIQGIQGPQGFAGNNGADGLPGQQGQPGPQGIQGIQGDIGPAGASGQQWVYRGEYNGGITYSPNDYVTLNGSSYVMINFIGAGGYDPIGYPGSWQLVASKGDAGTNGTNGQDGSTGPQGPQGDTGPSGGPQGDVGPEGPQGPQGNDGSQGPSGADAPPLIFKGYYNNTIQYDPYDVVYWVDDSNSYVMTQSAGGSGYPPDNSSYWTLYNTGGHGNVFTTGATFTGKVNMAAPTLGSASLNLGIGTAPTTSVAGDIWIATNINYKASDGTLKAVANTNTTNTFTQPQIISNSGASAALRITQLGTGEAFRVEDSTTPDSSAFVISSDGRVAVGVSSAYTSMSRFSIVGDVNVSHNYVLSVEGPSAGAIISTGGTPLIVQSSGGLPAALQSGVKIGTSSAVTINTITAVQSAPLTPVYNQEIPITIGGVIYRIPCRTA